jgi:hypothetical protein
LAHVSTRSGGTRFATVVSSVTNDRMR